MTSPDETKRAAVKRCLASARQLGIDMAHLLPCDLSGMENQFLRSAYGHLDSLLVELDNLHHGKKRERAEEKPGPEQKREPGSIKL